MNGWKVRDRTMLSLAAATGCAGLASVLALAALGVTTFSGSTLASWPLLVSFALSLGALIAYCMGHATVCRQCALTFVVLSVPFGIFLALLSALEAGRGAFTGWMALILLVVADGFTLFAPGRD